jgi:signal transduction histidine kinase
MKRPWQVWCIFLACVLGAAAAMVWLTRQALRSDELRRAAEAETDLEQRVSLALWRMDTALAPIIAEEVIRPPAAYRAIVTMPPNAPAQVQAQEAVQLPAQQGVQSVAQQSAEQAPPQLAQQAEPTPPQLPIPEPPEYVQLQFEIAPDGTWQSPQVPQGQSQDSAPAQELAALSRTVDVPQLLAKLPSTPLPTVADVGRNIAAMKSAPQTADYNPFQFFADNSQPNPPPSSEPADAWQDDDLFGSDDEKVAKPIGKFAKGKAADFGERSQRIQSVAEQTFFNKQRANVAANASGINGNVPEQVGVSRPLWVGNHLILARRVGGNGDTVVQGSLLDWPQVKKRLLTETADLLPSADLVPVPENIEADPGRMLAGLPVRLVVGPMAATDGLSPTLRWALWMGWGALALATAAAAALLAGVMALSERRAAFVSSVTHELRTPLTTFRMYSEMLARGMVPDAGQRQEYLSTLQREAERLTLLVENVLAYARLERGRRPQAIERVQVADMLERIGPRLAQRATQAGMQCEVEIDAAARGRELTTDTNVVEQILFNLVDNAAKYASAATDRRIHLTASANGTSLRLAVCDHGPGIEQRRLGRGMQPFGKSAQESAESAPGVGLGLALCGRLARQLGGRLDFSSTPGGGATVTLALPTN